MLKLDLAHAPPVSTPAHVCAWPSACPLPHNNCIYFFFLFCIHCATSHRCRRAERSSEPRRCLLQGRPRGGRDPPGRAPPAARAASLQRAARPHSLRLPEQRKARQKNSILLYQIHVSATCERGRRKYGCGTMSCRAGSPLCLRSTGWLAERHLEKVSANSRFLGIFRKNKQTKLGLTQSS